MIDNPHLLNGLFNNNAHSQPSNQSQSTASATQQNYNTSQSSPSVREPSPSGFSWGEDMPNEECQFNYNGNYLQYFESIFRSEFPEYNITWAYGDPRAVQSVVFTFVKNGRTALIVELMSEKSNARRIRNNCQRNGISYLRYYYDHDGWWNTKAYVISRTRQALSV